MSYFFELISGPEKGKKFKVSIGDTFGRSQGTHLINDPKISSLHAELKVSKNGELLLVDRGSSNGIKFKEQRLRTLPLTDGIEFILGNSTILVRITEVKTKKSSPLNLESIHIKPEIKSNPVSFDNPSPSKKDSNDSADPLPIEINEPILKRKKTERLPWDLFLKSSIKKLTLSNAPEGTTPVSNFKTILSLVFVKGPDSEKEFLLGYGPRFFGFQCLDFELSDTTLPEIAFSIAPDIDKNPVISKLNDFTILLNGKPFSSEKLNDNDQIEFGQNLFVVRINEKK
jgi:hypothetical protein